MEDINKLEYFYDTSYVLKCIKILEKSGAPDLFDRCKEILNINDDFMEGLLRDFIHRMVVR